MVKDIDTSLAEFCCGRNVGYLKWLVYAVLLFAYVSQAPKMLFILHTKLDH